MKPKRPSGSPDLHSEHCSITRSRTTSTAEKEEAFFQVQITKHCSINRSRTSTDEEEEEFFQVQTTKHCSITRSRAASTAQKEVVISGSNHTRVLGLLRKLWKSLFMKSWRCLEGRSHISQDALLHNNQRKGFEDKCAIGGKLLPGLCRHWRRWGLIHSKGVAIASLSPARFGHCTYCSLRRKSLALFHHYTQKISVAIFGHIVSVISLWF